MNAFGKYMTMFGSQFRNLILLINIWPARIDNDSAPNFICFSISSIPELCLPFPLSIPDTSQRFHVIDCGAVIVNGRTYKIENKACVIVVEKSIRVFKAADTVIGVDRGLLVIDLLWSHKTWGTCKKITYCPIKQGSAIKQKW